MGTGSIAVITDGKSSTIGFCRQKSNAKELGHLRTKKPKVADTLTIIKLSRETVHSCAEGKTSKAFSYNEMIVGQNALIYCTAEHGGGFCTAFIGTVTKVTQKNARCYGLKGGRRVHLSEFGILAPQHV